MRFHPAAVLLTWLFAVVLIQSLVAYPLAGALFLLFVLGLRLDASSCRRLLRRIRFLLLAVFVLFAFFTPGRALVVDIPALSPSVEGLSLACLHAGRLVAVVLLVVMLRALLGNAEIVTGIYRLLRPAAGLGLPVERLALRIMLVLREVDRPPADGWRAWLFGDGDGRDESAPVQLREIPLGWRDLVLVLSSGGAMLWGVMA